MHFLAVVDLPCVTCKRRRTSPAAASVVMGILLLKDTDLSDVVLGCMYQLKSKPQEAYNGTYYLRLDKMLQKSDTAGCCPCTTANNSAIL